jgi:hypothetical protein
MLASHSYDSHQQLVEAIERKHKKYMEFHLVKISHNTLAFYLKK